MTDAQLSRSVNLLVIHHSASARNVDVETIAGWHHERGFSAIGYHHVLTGDGIVHPGRDLARAGAHAAGHNTHSIGLCVVGDNTKPSQEWTTAQRNTLVLYVRWFRTFFPAADVFGHRDLPGANTLCPGLDVRALLAELGAL